MCIFEESFVKRFLFSYCKISEVDYSWNIIPIGILYIFTLWKGYFSKQNTSQMPRNTTLYNCHCDSLKTSKHRSISQGVPSQVFLSVFLRNGHSCKEFFPVEVASLNFLLIFEVVNYRILLDSLIYSPNFLY